jgi:hypothetical protein
MDDRSRFKTKHIGPNKKGIKYDDDICTTLKIAIFSLERCPAVKLVLLQEKQRLVLLVECQ